MTAPDGDTLDEDIARFKDGHPEALDPAAVHDHCAQLAFEFAAECAGKGLDAEVVWFEGDLNGEAVSHAVVAVAGEHVDWAFRQYDPDANVPVRWAAPPPWAEVHTVD